MFNREIHICRDYIEAVFAKPMQSLNATPFSPDWLDQPSRFKIYQQVERFPLPVKLPASLATVADVLLRSRNPLSHIRKLSLDEFATILLFAHGVLNRRLIINWIGAYREQRKYHFAIYGRGTPSGGGLYPTEIYWACGQSGPLLPGLYHYDPAHHAVERLAIGDVTKRIQAAVFNHPFAITTDQFLLISLNFWKNAFKYSNFGYHVMTQDVGALLCSLRLMSIGFKTDIPFLLWYRDRELNHLLGLDTSNESTFAVVPISLTAHPLISGNEVIRPGCIADAPPELQEEFVTKGSFQRSKKVITFHLVEQVHHATLVDKEACPVPSGSSPTSCEEIEMAGELVTLPSPALGRLQCDILEAFQKRHSSFGNLSSRMPLSRLELATLLYAGMVVCNYPSDLKQRNGTPHFTRLMVFVNNVEWLDRGIYAYDWKRLCLQTVYKGNFTSLLQQHYRLNNYNLAETAAVIVIIGKPDCMLGVYGNRGYRMLNAEAGLIAQGIYITAAALSLGCGAVLGFDNNALNKLLGLEGSDQRSLLFLLVGHERQHIAAFNTQFL